jgi:predicted metal-dependent peptidase
MQFSKIIGKIDPKLIEAAEDKMSKLFIELSLNYENTFVGSQIGGDILVFTLIYPVEQVATLNMPTAATDAKFYYWNPKFIIKKSLLGLRFIAYHEAMHAIYMHPQRRGSRHPKLWNIAIDYIVNGMVLEDLQIRKKKEIHDQKALIEYSDNLFTKEVGRHMRLEQYAQLLKDPFSPVKGFEDLDFRSLDKETHIELPHPGENRELTKEEQKELERREKKVGLYFADPDLTEEFKSPEAIYEYLYKLLPKCPKCGSIGKYKMPKKGDGKGDGKGDEKGDKDKDKNGKGKGCGCDDCDGCGDGVDIFGFGDLIDDHIDSDEDPEKMAKRISDAMETARRLAGHIPAALEEELGKLTAPKISWKDIIRTRLLRARSGGIRNDWTTFKSRPMFGAMMVPKKKSYHCQFGCLLDTSGSMCPEDMAFGISQLAALDDRAEGIIVCCDAEIYWDDAIKIKKCNIGELSKIKVKGRGGTQLCGFTSEYEKYIGKCDFLVIISDMYLTDVDVASMIDPGIDVFWLCTSVNSGFRAPFGKILSLRD